MKKRILSLVLALCLVVPCVCAVSACKSGATVYTVTESEWEINFNITKTPTQAQTLSCSPFSNQTQVSSSNPLQSLAAITSYTLSAEGVSEGTEGSGLLKVAPNGMYMEFYLDGVFRPDESGTTPSSDPWYVGMTTMLKSYFPFSGRYNDFAFDQTKNAYVANNIVSTVINEEDITETYEIFNKKAEITFINGYLNTVSIELCSDNTFTNVYLSLTFTFSDINKTTVDIPQS